MGAVLTLLLAALPQAELPRTAGWLVLEQVDAAGRIPFGADAVFAAHLLDPASPPPQAGARVAGSRGSASWTAASEGDEVPLRGNGWAFAEVRAEEEGVWIARLEGASRLFVNGDGFAGDLYRYGFAGVPVALRAGANLVYVGGARGSFRLTFAAPDGPLHRIPQDDLLVPRRSGEPGSGRALWTVANATLRPMTELALAVEDAGGARRERMALPLLPLAVGRLDAPLPPERPPADARPLTLHVAGEGGAPLLRQEFALPSLAPDAPGLFAFVSGVDGSVQKWAAVPPPAAGAEPPALVLSLHGAGVDCAGQAAAYAAKPGFYLACPTNRRPYGFDWQDWGRQDAYEALREALRRSGAPEDRVCLTGHSMGGHGTWHLAVNDADRWAAIAPSAGWASFDSYGGRPKGARDDLWRGADGASETLALLPNLRGLPIYALHGAADDNVPLREMEALLAELGRLGIAARSHVQPDAGHWWGNACVDWPPIFETFAAARRPAPEAVRELDFRTADPGVDARHHWIEIEQLLEYGKPARAHARWEGDMLVFQELENVRRYRVHFPGGESRGFVAAGPDGWSPADGPVPPGEKSPALAGPFKRAFDRDFVIVYGTAGDAAENAECLARARHDAQVWWYRANACPWILSDREYLNRRNFPRLGGRNVILYGNADTNAAWPWLVPESCPLRAERGLLRLGAQEWRRDDLAALCLTPGAEGTTAPLVGLVADTGVAGGRLGYALRLFVSGVGYPDYVAWGPEVLREGDGAVLAAGFFDHRWRLP